MTTAAIALCNELKEYVDTPEKISIHSHKLTALFQQIAKLYFFTESSDVQRTIKAHIRSQIKDFIKFMPRDTLLKSGNVTIEAKGLAIALKYAAIDRWIREAAAKQSENAQFVVHVNDIAASDLTKLVECAEANREPPEELSKYSNTLNILNSPRISPRLHPANPDVMEEFPPRAVRRKSSGHSPLSAIFFEQISDRE